MLAEKHENLLPTIKYIQMFGDIMKYKFTTKPITEVRVGDLVVMQVPALYTFKTMCRKDITTDDDFKKCGAITPSKRRNERDFLTFDFFGVANCSLWLQRYTSRTHASDAMLTRFGIRAPSSTGHAFVPAMVQDDSTSEPRPVSFPGTFDPSLWDDQGFFRIMLIHSTKREDRKPKNSGVLFGRATSGNLERETSGRSPTSSPEWDQEQPQQQPSHQAASSRLFGPSIPGNSMVGPPRSLHAANQFLPSAPPSGPSNLPAELQSMELQARINQMASALENLKNQFKSKKQEERDRLGRSPSASSSASSLSSLPTPVARQRPPNGQLIDPRALFEQQQRAHSGNGVADAAIATAVAAAAAAVQNGYEGVDLQRRVANALFPQLEFIQTEAAQLQLQQPLHLPTQPVEALDIKVPPNDADTLMASFLSRHQIAGTPHSSYSPKDSFLSGLSTPSLASHTDIAVSDSMLMDNKPPLDYFRSLSDLLDNFTEDPQEGGTFPLNSPVGIAPTDFHVDPMNRPPLNNPDGTPATTASSDERGSSSEHSSFSFSGSSGGVSNSGVGDGLMSPSSFNYAAAAAAIPPPTRGGITPKTLGSRRRVSAGMSVAGPTFSSTSIGSDGTPSRPTRRIRRREPIIDPNTPQHIREAQLYLAHTLNTALARVDDGNLSEAVFTLNTALDEEKRRTNLDPSLVSPEHLLALRKARVANFLRLFELKRLEDAPTEEFLLIAYELLDNSQPIAQTTDYCYVLVAAAHCLHMANKPELAIEVRKLAEAKLTQSDPSSYVATLGLISNIEAHWGNGILAAHNYLQRALAVGAVPSHLHLTCTESKGHVKYALEDSFHVRLLVWESILAWCMGDKVKNMENVNSLTSEYLARPEIQTPFTDCFLLVAHLLLFHEWNIPLPPQVVAIRNATEYMLVEHYNQNGNVHKAKVAVPLFRHLILISTALLALVQGNFRWMQALEQSCRAFILEELTNRNTKHLRLNAAIVISLFLELHSLLARRSFAFDDPQTIPDLINISLLLPLRHTDTAQITLSSKIVRFKDNIQALQSLASTIT